MKNEVYRSKVDTRDELLDNIMGVISRINKSQGATHHVLTRVARYIDVDSGIFENVLYLVNCTNFVTWTINTIKSYLICPDKQSYFHLSWHRPAVYQNWSVILTGKHNHTDPICWFLFSTATCFGYPNRQRYNCYYYKIVIYSEKTE